MENYQQEKAQKQSYLRENILDKNYDPQEFIKFLNSKLNINSDIDLCSLQDLVKVVQQYISQKQQTLSQSKGVNISLPQSIQLSQKQMQKKNNKIIFKQYKPPIQQQAFSQQMKCILLQQKYHNRKQLICQVANPQRKTVGGILGLGATSFLQFQIYTYGKGWQVGRRYSDFIWLRNYLTKFYPTQIIPPIPNKKASKRSPRHIKKRMKILTFFLNDIVQKADLFNSKYVQGFLCMKDLQKFEALKRQAQNKKCYESISSIQTPTGLVKIQLSQQNVTYKNQLKSLVSSTQILYKQITRNSKKFQVGQYENVNILYQMGNQFGQLYERSQKFIWKVQSSHGVSKLHDIYITLNNLLVEWGNNIKTQAELMEDNWNTFFKYVREQFMGYHELLKREEQIELQWAQMKQSLDKKKQKLFTLHDVNKWQIPKSELAYLPKSCVHQKDEAFKVMLPKESNQVEQVKKRMAHYLTSIHENSQKHSQRVVDRFCQNFKQFTIKSKVTNQQMGELWVEMSSNFSDPKRKLRRLKKMQKIRLINQEGDEYDNVD